MKRKLKEKIHLQEMGNIRQDDSGLPVNIWVDESGSYKGHAKRIKFQLDHHPNLHKPVCPMLLTGVIPRPVENSELFRNKKISQHDIQQVSNFVVNNAYALEKLADQLIRIKDFEKIMIIGGEKAASEQLDFLKKQTDEWVEFRKAQLQKYFEKEGTT